MNERTLPLRFSLSTLAAAVAFATTFAAATSSYAAGTETAYAADPSAQPPAPALVPTSSAATAPGAGEAAHFGIAADPATPETGAPATNPAAPPPWHLGAHAELDAGILLAMKQGAAFAGGVVYGPFRAGMSYATFLSNSSFGGTPDGFSLRANYIVGINASYFIGKSSDDGLYVQAMFHIKQQGVTNEATGDHRDLNSLAAGLELGYLWKVYRGLYVAPRVGALYYLKSPQGSENQPVR
ncbi:MAG: autotransporter outer membrane beta-barrel domain-containing protein, partial [Polyangiaceae bacterium]